jgi:N-acetylmuramoyl-L-alanine amidase
MMLSPGRLCYFLLAAAISAWAAPAGVQAPSLRVSGRDYASLTEWAEGRNLRLRWLKRDETFELTNSSWRISLGVDSRRAELNGIAVWLLFPVVSRNGRLWISQEDVLFTMRPILSPAMGKAMKPIRTICLDPGHGGEDPGFMLGSNHEKTYTLLLAQELRQQLTKAGFKVTLTRSTDSSLDLPTRPELARRRNADLFLSLHFNAVGESAARRTVRGVEVYCLTPRGAPSTNSRGESSPRSSSPGHQNSEKNLLLAFEIQRSLTQSLDAEDRGVHRGNLAVLRDAIMPAVLVEAGFLSHPAEGKKILTAAYRRDIAKAVVSGVQAYQQQVKRAS